MGGTHGGRPQKPARVLRRRTTAASAGRGATCERRNGVIHCVPARHYSRVRAQESALARCRPASPPPPRGLHERRVAATAPQRFQISTDGFQPYVSAITTTLSDRCDFAQLIKVYTEAPKEERRRYSPPDVTHAERVPVMGNPDPEKI